MSREIDRRDFSVNRVTPSRENELRGLASDVSDNVLPGEHRVVAESFDATTGNFIWSFTTEGHTTFDGIYCSPAVANGIVYIYTSEGNIYAFGTAVIPEGLTLGVMLALSTIAVVVSARYFRKRQKWENW